MTDRYKDERYDPALAHCTKLELKFNGTHLTMTGGKKTYQYPAVSGPKLKDKPFDYSLLAQQSPNAGPIPEGKYWIRPDELWERTWVKKIYFSDAHRAGWGDYRVTIHPFTTTQTHKRGGFFIHGGKNPGSAGCIDLTSNMPIFVRDLRQEDAIKKCQIHLTVEYPKSK